MLVVARGDVRPSRVIALREHLEHAVEGLFSLGIPDQTRYELHLAVLG